MRNHFPDPAHEAGQSLKKIADAAKQGAQRSPDLLGKALDATTHGLVRGVAEAFSFPLRAVAWPTMRTVNDLAVGTVKNAVGLAGDWLKTIRFIPAPGGRNADDPASPEGRGSLASIRDIRLSPLLRPGDPRRGSGSPPPSPNPEPRPEVRPT